MDWKPIETAPKDGTVIDLFCPDDGRWADCYWGKPEHSCGEAGQYCDSEWHSLDDGWVCTTINQTVPDPVSHWMPIPEDPKPTK